MLSIGTSIYLPSDPDMYRFLCQLRKVHRHVTTLLLFDFLFDFLQISFYQPSPSGGIWNRTRSKRKGFPACSIRLADIYKRHSRRVIFRAWSIAQPRLQIGIRKRDGLFLMPW